MMTATGDGDLQVGDPVLVEGRLCDVVARAEERDGCTWLVEERTSHWQRGIREDLERRDYVNQASIRTFVYQFYGKVRDDPTLGPVFDRRLEGRWEAHLEKMVVFWSAVLLAIPGYRGNPKASHVDLDDAKPEHITRWLSLFEQTLNEIYEPGCVSEIMYRAQRMARGLSQAMFGQPFDGGPVGVYPRQRN